jgi:hypothetical protein
MSFTGFERDIKCVVEPTCLRFLIRCYHFLLSTYNLHILSSRHASTVNNEDGSKDDTIDVESIINFIPFEFTDDDDFIIIVAKEFAKSVTDEILHGAKNV